MSKLWATRQRNTNRLVRLVAPIALNGKQVLPDQLYGLCKLTWITSNPQADDAPYIQSTKIPALGDIFQRDFSGLTLEEVAIIVSDILKDPSAASIIRQHTGFTNFYNAYRNASKYWIRQNLHKLIPLFEAAFGLSSDDQGRELASKLTHLDGIVNPGNSESKLPPAFLLTPVLFALDGRLRFPMINGNKGVKNLLRTLGASKAPLETQYSRMIELYGQGGIADAADLDQAGPDLPEFIATQGTAPTKQLLGEQPTIGEELPLKDESDVQSIRSAQTLANKRLHNSLTNKLKIALSAFVLYEGRNKDIMFDAMIKNYNFKGDDLLIEVKSSTEIAHIRMAVGQLYSYSYRLNFENKSHLAVLLPERPGTEIEEWLAWLDIGLLWFSGDDLYSSSERLHSISKDAT